MFQIIRMNLPRWEQERSRNTFISLKVREMNVAAQEKWELLLHTYIIEDPKGQDYCALRLGTIVSIVIFTPPVRGVKKYIKSALK